MLTDRDGYDAWERKAIAMLARRDRTAGHALAVVEAATLAVQSWRPGGISLRDAVIREFDVASAREPDEDLDEAGTLDDDVRVRLALDSIPRGPPCPPLVDRWQDEWRTVSPWWGEADAAVRGYLAARLFGNWVAYCGPGLRAIVEYLRVALDLVKMEAVSLEAARHGTRESPSSPWQIVDEALRNADLLLVHLSDMRALSPRLGGNRQG